MHENRCNSNVNIKVVETGDPIRDKLRKTEICQEQKKDVKLRLAQSLPQI
jgi:hypothetical protein